MSVKTKKKNSWGGQGNGKGGYYSKKNVQIPWRQQKRENPYPEDLDEMLSDPKYIKDRDDLFREHGNGWWWTAPFGVPQKRER